jgi:hypothetical protein
MSCSFIWQALPLFSLGLTILGLFTREWEVFETFISRSATTFEVEILFLLFIFPGQA